MNEDFSAHRNRRLVFPIIAVLFLAVGFTLRLYHLDAQALSGDEAFSIMQWTRKPLSEVFSTIALIDPQPPATLLSLIGWTHLAGDSVFAVRYFSLLTSVITLAATYGIARQLFNRQSATVPLALMSITPFQIWYAQDMRSYSMWMATSSLSAWAFLLALKRPTNWRRWIAYTLTAALGIYTFYLELFFLAAQDLYALLTLRRDKWRPWLASQIGIAVLLAPWFLQPSLRHSGYQPTAGPANVPWAFASLLFGETPPPQLDQPIAVWGTHQLTPLALIAIILTVVAFWLLIRVKQHRQALWLGLYTLFPIVALTILTVVTSNGYFRPRYIAAASGSFVILAATLIAPRGHSRSRRPGWRLDVGGALTALLIVALDGATLWTYFNTYDKAPDWPAIMDLLESNTTPDDVIVRNYPDPAFDYYYAGAARDIIVPASSNASAAQTEAQLAELLTSSDYIWFLPTPTSYYDKGEVVDTWLRQNAQLVSEEWIGVTHILQFATWDVAEDAIANQVDIRFGDVAALRGYATLPGEKDWEPGETIHLELFWEPLTQTEAPLTVFVHVLGPTDADGLSLVAQDDSPPQGGRLSTISWPINTLFRDPRTFTIPDSAPAGHYVIGVGLYDPVTLERIALDAEIPQSDPDSAILLEFTLEE